MDGSPAGPAAQGQPARQQRPQDADVVSAHLESIRRAPEAPYIFADIIAKARLSSHSPVSAAGSCAQRYSLFISNCCCRTLRMCRNVLFALDGAQVHSHAKCLLRPVAASCAPELSYASMRNFSEQSAQVRTWHRQRAVSLARLKLVHTLIEVQKCCARASRPCPSCCRA